MKLSIIAAALMLGVANAADCDLTAFKSLLTNTDVTQCTTDSGFVFVPPAPATETQLPLICKSSACQAVVAAVEAISPTECTLVGIELYAELLDPIISFCGGGSSSGDDTAVGSGDAGSVEVTTSSTGSTEVEAGSESSTSGSGSTAAAAGSTTSGAVSVSVASGLAVLAAAAATLL